MAPARARALSAGPSPWWRIASGARPRRSWGRPTERGLPAGQHHCGSAFGQVTVSPNRAPGAPGQVGRKIEPGAAPGGHGHVTIQSAFWLALSRQVTLGRVASPPTAQATRTPRPGRRAVPDAGAGIFAPSSGPQGVITDLDHPGRGSGLARAVLCPSDGSRTAGLECSR